MLSETLLKELFNLTHPVSDIITTQVSDELEQLGASTLSIDNYDLTVIFNLKFHTYEVEVIVSRTCCDFTICATDGNETILPMCGDWDMVVKYLHALSPV